ncbi:MAG TPA: hypothetical protein PLA18_16160, partial [Deltaproteobacteria bacterium]|nr:hypothetical protein [Deltaproteobacteria bacterium]
HHLWFLYMSKKWAFPDHVRKPSCYDQSRVKALDRIVQVGEVEGLSLMDMSIFICPIIIWQIRRGTFESIGWCGNRPMERG